MNYLRHKHRERKTLLYNTAGAISLYVKLILSIIASKNCRKIRRRKKIKQSKSQKQFMADSSVSFNK